MTSKRWNVSKKYSKDKEVKIITTDCGKKALRSYIHYDLGFIPETMIIHKAGITEEFSTVVGNKLYQSILKRS